MAARPALSIKGRALRYLAQREHSRAELERKLARRATTDPDFDPVVRATAVARALDELTAAGLLDDSRAAASVVRTQAPRYGDAHLRHSLRQRGVPDAQAQAALESLASDEYLRALAVWRRRFGDQPAADVRERARQARFLAGRGFPARLIHRIVRGLDTGDANPAQTDTDPDPSL